MSNHVIFGLGIPDALQFKGMYDPMGAIVDEKFCSMIGGDIMVTLNTCQHKI